MEIHRHNRAIAEIARTPPLCASGPEPMFLSMLRHSDVLMYLLAIKSVYAQLGRGLITIVNDGSLTAADRRLLDHHLGRVRYLQIQDVDTTPCPRGGTWERLLAILDSARDHYLIQVDADIVALGDLAEVGECIRDNRAFTLGGDPSSRLESVGETSASARKHRDPHVQLAAERLLDQMPGAGSLKYVRGCSAFAGFPRGGNRSAIVAFSNWMEQRLGRQWHDWGSEQVASNFLIANCPDPLILPWPKYRSFFPGSELAGANLIHFFGTYRFMNGEYAAQSRRAIANLTHLG
ncbi:MAG TPA: hypothetical protein VNF99_20560 [Stellaceae bacterium]|nr:hypothetical protein [Stellaceae bacterium]